jgi:predicted nucleotidyltransferase
MINQYDIIKFLSDHLSSFKDEHHISRLGSFARNEQNDSSDIDIILEFKEGTENIYEKKSRLREFLINHFQRDVDLCREKYLVL